MIYVIQFCRKLTSRIRMEMQFLPDPACKLSSKMQTYYGVKSLTLENGI
jgi:hypothetical protein